MIAVSDAWKEKQREQLSPEGFVEISCRLTETGVQEEAVATGVNESLFSDVVAITGNTDEQTTRKYATFERNLWVLDGTRTIIPSTDLIHNIGYVSDVAGGGSVTLSLPRVHTESIPGVTIVWSSEYGEYAPAYTVVAKNGDEIVATMTIEDNTSNKSLVYLTIENYDSVTVDIHSWSVPDHRPRVDSVILGLDITFTKNDIISYTHEQNGCALSGELPKNSIEFSVDNIDGRWDPNNPRGLEQYLSERMRVKVRYGLDIDGTTEWIKAGTFYLSEWTASSNGMEASFVARDAFEFLLSREEPVETTVFGSLDFLVRWATNGTLPNADMVVIDPVLEKYSAEFAGDATFAEIVQKCANAACCVIRCDRDGLLYIEPMDRTLSDYVIPLEFAYAYPEITLSKPLGAVSVKYGELFATRTVGNGEGETQTVENSFVTTYDQAWRLAGVVREMLVSRKKISGEFRADPRLDLFDVVTVEGKYGDVTPVVITNIKYSFSGAFRGSYTGHVLVQEGA